MDYIEQRGDLEYEDLVRMYGDNFLATGASYFIRHAELSENHVRSETMSIPDEKPEAGPASPADETAQPKSLAEARALAQAEERKEARKPVDNFLADIKVLLRQTTEAHGEFTGEKMYRILIDPTKQPDDEGYRREELTEAGKLFQKDFFIGLFNFARFNGSPNYLRSAFIEVSRSKGTKKMVVSVVPK